MNRCARRRGKSWRLLNYFSTSFFSTIRRHLAVQSVQALWRSRRSCQRTELCNILSSLEWKDLCICLSLRSFNSGSPSSARSFQVEFMLTFDCWVHSEENCLTSYLSRVPNEF